MKLCMKSRAVQCLQRCGANELPITIPAELALRRAVADHVADRRCRDGRTRDNARLRKRGAKAEHRAIVLVPSGKNSTGTASLSRSLMMSATRSALATLERLMNIVPPARAAFPKYGHVSISALATKKHGIAALRITISNITEGKLPPPAHAWGPAPQHGTQCPRCEIPTESPAPSGRAAPTYAVPSGPAARKRAMLISSTKPSATARRIIRKLIASVARGSDCARTWKASSNRAE